MMKIVIAAGATLALVTAAGAADIPRPQPVYQQAQFGKMPIGKTPIGKTPIGKSAPALCAVLIQILVEFELYRRQLKGEPWRTGRRDQDYACLRDSLSCSSAKSILLLHARLTFSRAWNVSFPPNRKSTSAPPTRTRLFPVRRPRN